MYFEYGENEILYLKSKDRKLAEVIEKVHSDAFNLDAVWEMSDEEAIRELSSLKGIGVWTAYDIPS